MKVSPRGQNWIECDWLFVVVVVVVVFARMGVSPVTSLAQYIQLSVQIVFRYEGLICAITVIKKS